MIAVHELTRAPHDGYTVLVAVNSLVSEVPHIVKLRVDMAQEVKPVAEIARTGLVLVGAPSVPAKDLRQLVSYAKTQPGKVSYASYNAGTMSHLLGLQFNKAAGIAFGAGNTLAAPSLAHVAPPIPSLRHHACHGAIAAVRAAGIGRVRLPRAG
ncbi:tripartite tricarboxylate transporter substrate-binding protein [Variovorax sp. HW608]|uniref:tripartite tricarboxylate transporter substrate-binding protein n=1 Tax=Variovorax sp. HW608 TaxID=1034889 RepID=UPI0012FE6417|nr:tripartite tricarboxylate transporter substrate-binding protein [Variovorax sp. HW608]